MKLSARPISSPGRVEKLPPQLMRFLRTNTASRSRRGSRSLASPIFIKERVSDAVETTEPSSPKVTCMGQVRVGRSKQGTRKKGGGSERHDRCRWIPRILFCRSSKGGGVGVGFSSFRHSKSHMPSWPKWVLFFRCWLGGGSGKWGFGDKDEGFGRRTGNKVEEDDDDDDDADEEIEGKVNCSVPSPCFPPKNALILTRCRSAPYSSSSLACRFWGSPLDAERAVRRMSIGQLPKTEHAGSENGGLAEEGGEWKETDYDRNPDRGIETDRRHYQEPWNSDGTGTLVQFKDRVARSDSGRNLRTGDGESEAVLPLMLTRCKSEPARTGENTRFGLVDSCSARAL